MARKSHEDALGVVGAQTIIGTGVEISGNLSSEADIIIDGTLEGSLTAGGNLTIGVNANVKANVEADNVTVAGVLHGDILANGEASILETGQVKGNIKAAGLAISSGGVFIGRSIMTIPSQLDADTQSQISHMTSGDR
jgi:cytoskeletal protein CcmA (bactofilin family)